MAKIVKFNENMWSYPAREARIFVYSRKSHNFTNRFSIPLPFDAEGDQCSKQSMQKGRMCSCLCFLKREI